MVLSQREDSEPMLTPVLPATPKGHQLTAFLPHTDLQLIFQNRG